MKNLLTGLLFLTSLTAMAQYSGADFTIKNQGLSSEYYARFRAKTEILAQTFNQLGITTAVKPVVILVGVENENGFIRAICNFSYDQIFTSGSDYYQHNVGMQRQFGNGISVYLQDQIATALSLFLKSVAEQQGGYALENAILKFETIVSLQKRNKDMMTLFANNVYNNQGFYRHTFYTNSIIDIAGKEYETEAGSQLLNDYKYLSIGKTEGLDGKKNGAYYLNAFFTTKEESETNTKKSPQTTKGKATPKYVYPTKR